MKKDDYIEKDEQKEGTAPGHCMFCGQTYSVGDSVAGMTQEQLDEEATKKCFCSEAKSYVRKNERRKKVDNYLKEVFLGEKVQGTIKQLIESAYKLAVSSTKSMTGHLLGAAGGVEAAATVLAIANGIIPPTINYRTPDPDCDLDIVPNEARKAEINVGISDNLGFGGHNAALVFKKV